MIPVSVIVIMVILIISIEKALDTRVNPSMVILSGERGGDHEHN